MGMFTVYCDDSGKDKKSRGAAVAGLISNVGQRELFNLEWARWLKEFKLTRCIGQTWSHSRVSFWSLMVGGHVDAMRSCKSCIPL
jgi:hypothetical protein